MDGILLGENYYNMKICSVRCKGFGDHLSSHQGLDKSLLIPGTKKDYQLDSGIFNNDLHVHVFIV